MNLTEIVLSLLAAIAAIVLHEVAHGDAALALGDDTARRLGRLTLNPIAHVDRVGTLIIPGALLIFQSIFGGHFVFGWAKPVPVDPRRFADPRRGMMLVAAAGPAINFCLAWLTALGGLITDFAFPFILFNLLLVLLPMLLRDFGISFDPVMSTIWRVVHWALGLLPFPDGRDFGV